MFELSANESSKPKYLSRLDIRTSSRRVFRRCFRKWGYSSSFRSNLQRAGSETNINFWFGSAIHWAMEDYFGLKRYGSPQEALRAYYNCFKPEDRPEGAEEHLELGLGMLDYFVPWYEKHNSQMQFETIWVYDGGEAPYKIATPGAPGARPLVEEEFTLNLSVSVLYDVKYSKILGEVTPELMKDLRPYDVDGDGITIYDKEDSDSLFKVIPVGYHGTMDRIVKDKWNRWWILDYKTAKGADVMKLDTDDQISAYCWAAEQHFQHPIAGFIYLQLTKEVPNPPKRLKSGELSVDKKQRTTYQLVRETLLSEYGSVSNTPKKYVDFLNFFAEQESEQGDRFVRWDLVERNVSQKIATYEAIMGETKLMIDPNLPLFPNPTRDCSWDCPFRAICIATDQGRLAEAQEMALLEFECRSSAVEHNREEWKDNLLFPGDDGYEQWINGLQPKEIEQELVIVWPTSEATTNK